MVLSPLLSLILSSLWYVLIGNRNPTDLVAVIVQQLNGNIKYVLNIVEQIQRNERPVVSVVELC
ncbi:hypothetical protein JCM10550A_15840 [Methanogenium cariaci]